MLYIRHDDAARQRDNIFSDFRRASILRVPLMLPPRRDAFADDCLRRRCCRFELRMPRRRYAATFMFYFDAIFAALRHLLIFRYMPR